MFNNLVLIGFSGVGKTTLAKEIAKEYNLDLFDTDDMIEKKQKKTISEIFSTYGEDKFRLLEKNTLISLQNKTKIVVSVGAGAIINKNELKSIGYIVYLNKPFEHIYSKLKAYEIGLRPLLKDKDKALALYNKRKLIYQELADITLDKLSISENLLSLNQALSY